MAIDKLSDTAAMHGAEADVRLLSDGAGVIIDNRYMLSAGTLQANFKTNPLAPVLYKQMEYTHMVQMELVKANAEIHSMYATLNKLQPTVPTKVVGEPDAGAGNGQPSKADTE